MIERNTYFVELYCPNGCIEPIPVDNPYPIGRGNWKCGVCGSLCQVNYKKKIKAILNPNRFPNYQKGKK